MLCRRSSSVKNSSARVALAAALLVLLPGCAEQDRESVFKVLKAPHADTLLTATVIEPWFPQGPHQVVIYVQGDAAAPRIEVARTELAFDGVPFTDKNIGMRWVSGSEALICLRATDRPDKSVYVNVKDGTPRGELRQGC